MARCFGRLLIDKGVLLEVGETPSHRCQLAWRQERGETWTRCLTTDQVKSLITALRRFLRAADAKV